MPKACVEIVVNIRVTIFGWGRRLFDDTLQVTLAPQTEMA